MSKKNKKLKGKVYDPVLDCCHRISLDEHGYDILHDALADFEGKEVEIIIMEKLT